LLLISRFKIKACARTTHDNNLFYRYDTGLPHTSVKFTF